jgi:hypothetical protein
MGVWGGCWGWGREKGQRAVFSPRITNIHKSFTVSKVLSHTLFQLNLIPNIEFKTVIQI